MVRFTIHELGLPQFRICQDLAGKYFVQELVEKGGFWSFTGHTRQEWDAYGTGYTDIKYYDTPNEAAQDIEKVLNQCIQTISQKKKLYDVFGSCLYVDLDETLGVLTLRAKLDHEN